ncbi:MAG TPA: N-acetyl-alpha-D-glucosaminyl L-malate synthase BshA [Planctomycetota bacterium]|nr:N-acetyl-alpha-D-glucosaminyl L-malate synthase BshA [Planctomycetota bacterium]
MRIGIACYPTYGGSGVVASELGIELAKRGHEVHVISYDLPFRLQGYRERIYFHEIEVGAYPLFKYPPFTLSAACKMIDIAETNRLDVLHVHYAVPWAVCAHLAREVVQENDLPLKIVTTLHGTDITLVGNEPSFFKMTRFGIQRSDAVTAVSDYLKKATQSTFKVDVPIHVIHNFIDSQRFRPKTENNGACQRKGLAPNGEKLLIHVSNFRPVKNIPDVVKTFALVRKDVPCRLLMVGEGPELPNARALAKKLGVESDVVFMGRQQAVEDILACADVFMLPSAFESFGLSALEAMSCGLPVLATEIGGLSEVITNGVDGWLCPVGDCHCMAERIYSLLTNEDKRRAMGDAARKKAVESFSPEKIIAEYESLYRSVISTGKRWKLVCQ